VPVEEIRSLSHDIAQTNFAPNAARITLKNGTTIPNKDFVLRYDVAGGKVQDALLTHRDERGGFFTLILQPPDRIMSDERTPKEIVFVLDTSGSMSGFPIEKAKEVVKYIKDSKLKVQASIQGETVRISGKDRDTLQEVIAALKGKDFGIDMTFDNYRSN
jgi:hypothetical protein